MGLSMIRIKGKQSLTCFEREHPSLAEQCEGKEHDGEMLRGWGSN